MNRPKAMLQAILIFLKSDLEEILLRRCQYLELLGGKLLI